MITIVSLDLADILLGLDLYFLVLLDVVADLQAVIEVHSAGFVDVERVDGDLGQPGVQTEEEEDWLQGDLTEAGLHSIKPVHT